MAIGSKGVLSTLWLIVISDENENQLDHIDISDSLLSN